MANLKNRPNMVIVKLNNNLVSFPLSEDGVLSDGQEFESDYELEDYHIIFASYDEESRTSVELSRFAHLREDKETSIQVLYEIGELNDFVQYIIQNDL